MPRARIKLRQNWRAELADRLHAARLLARLRQCELAQAIGKSQCVVSRVESGKYLPTVPVMLRWARACGVKPGHFLEGLL